MKPKRTRGSLGTSSTAQAHMTNRIVIPAHVAETAGVMLVQPAAPVPVVVGTERLLDAKGELSALLRAHVAIPEPLRPTFSGYIEHLAGDIDPPEIGHALYDPQAIGRLFREDVTGMARAIDQLDQDALAAACSLHAGGLSADDRRKWSTAKDDVDILDDSGHKKRKKKAHGNGKAHAHGQGKDRDKSKGKSKAKRLND